MAMIFSKLHKINIDTKLSPTKYILIHLVHKYYVLAIPLSQTKKMVLSKVRTIKILANQRSSKIDTNYKKIIQKAASQKLCFMYRPTLN